MGSKAGLTRGFKIWSKSSSLGNELNLKLNKRLLTETTCEMTNAVECCRRKPKLEGIGLHSPAVVLPITVLMCPSSKFGQNPSVNH